MITWEIEQNLNCSMKFLTLNKNMKSIRNKRDSEFSNNTFGQEPKSGVQDEEGEARSMDGLRKYISCNNLLLSITMIVFLILGMVFMNNIHLFSSQSHSTNFHSPSLQLKQIGDLYKSALEETMSRIQYILSMAQFILQNESVFTSLSSSEASGLIFEEHDQRSGRKEMVCFQGTLGNDSISFDENLNQTECQSNFPSSINAVLLTSDLDLSPAVEQILACLLKNGSLTCQILTSHTSQSHMSIVNQGKYFDEIKNVNEDTKISRGDSNSGNHILLSRACTAGSFFIIASLQLSGISISDRGCEQCSQQVVFGVKMTYPIYIPVVEVTSGSHIQISVTNSLNSSVAMKFQISEKSRDNNEFINCLLIILPIFASLLCFIFFILQNRKSNNEFIHESFSKFKILNELYKNLINEIFSFKKTTASNILQSGPMSKIFCSLSEISHKSIIPIQQQKQWVIEKESFRFGNKMAILMEKYKGLISKLMCEKNKSILNNRFNIQSYINELCEEENKKMKNYYLRTQEMHIEKEFFLFAYMAVLKTPEKFLLFIKEDETPFPDELAEYFVKMNQLLHETEIVREQIEKHSLNEVSEDHAARESRPEWQRSKVEELKESEQEMMIEENRDEVEIRIRVHLIPKYLTMLRDLDIQNYYAQELSLERQIWSLTEIVENTRYLLTKHNKNIRFFSK